MKKRFLLGMSFLLIASALQPSTLPSWDDYNDDTEIEEKYPYTYQSFQDIKKEFPHAGFQKITLAEPKKASNRDELSACCTFNKKTGIISGGIIMASNFTFEKIETIISKMHNNATQVTAEEQCYIQYHKAALLHESYHCSFTAERKRKGFVKPTVKERFATFTPILLGNAFAQIKSQLLKTRPALPLPLSLLTGGALIAADIALTKIKTIQTKYKEEYDADMHMVKHADGLSLSNLILQFRKNDARNTPNFVLHLLAQKELAHPIIKPVYSSLIDLRLTARDMYSDPGYPTEKYRVQYLLKALQEKHPQYADQVTALLKTIDTSMLNVAKAAYDEMLKKPSNHEELTYIQGLV